MELLTSRQKECLKWRAKGLTAKEIGARLTISPRTVETHLHYARTRTGRRTVELAVIVANQK